MGRKHNANTGLGDAGFRRRIKARMVECDISVAAVCSTLAFSRETWRARLSGERAWTGRELRLLADLLGVSFHELLGVRP
ncbi:MAG: helix-turn-helix transcriptional regulator [Proteobacteria bacterium]|nr:helix-turn-helix transcriptional regulator [Pseudomonadota bacterium]